MRSEGGMERANEVKVFVKPKFLKRNSQCVEFTMSD